jgi:stage II sporulation protein D
MKSLTAALALSLAVSCATAPPPSPTTTTTSTPMATAPRSPNALTDVANVAKSIVEPRIRVGLLSDQTTVTFPRIEGGYYLVTPSRSMTLRRGFTATAPLSDTTKRYAVQASTISDQASAEAFAAKLRKDTGQRVDAIFDPAGGAYRVLAGDFADTTSAQPLRDQLQSGGYGTGMLIVRRPSDAPFERRHLLVDDEGERYTLDGDSILIMPMTADTIAIGEKPYRTSARLFINARGLYNVINELNMEDYLLGVVPAEMGSKIYDEVEALKAQAIAARTYAVRNLGQYRTEGYDICPGPACQAYNGFSGEEALSSQAVRESKGLILTYEGKPIDALYTATCGGETSDVGVMFPGRNEPYLKHARCVELDMTTLAGRADSGVLTEQQLNGRYFAAAAGVPDSGASWSARDVVEAVTKAAQSIGFPMPANVAPPASSRRGDVLTYLARVMKLDQNARVLTMPEDRKYFFPQSANPESTPNLAAAFLIKYGFLPTQNIDRIDMNAAMPREDLHGLLGTWLRKHDALKEVTGKILTLSGRTMTLKAEGKGTPFTLPDGIPVFRRIGDRVQEYRSAPVMIGDRAYIELDARRRPVAVTILGNFDGASFDRTSSFADWTRTFRADELLASIKKRNPISQLIGIRPLSVDASQRIQELEVTAEGGRTFVLRGLPIRWSLNVPDNLFVYEVTKDADGMDRYTFYGKGWGHGVGFCQVGAYGMAFRGWNAEQILKNYYTGVELVPMAAAAPASSSSR